MANHLAGETSPYLLQHADNPVEWHPWGEAALQLAREQNKPILLSIGYSACHWCHVMAHESFEDAEIAAVMNKLFINIKVDREERPDLDQIYQSVHHMLAQRSGGWPLTIFMAPDCTPFYTGTYFPKHPRYNLPGFADLCERVAQAWVEQRDAILTQNVNVRQALTDMSVPEKASTAPLNSAPVHALIAHLDSRFDERYGGFGGAPKFPHPSDIEILLRSAAADIHAYRVAALTSAPTQPLHSRPLRIALSTLSHMANGGINDQLGGGFCRYSVDARWNIPHFEKMLYDNGPLLRLYADAHLATSEPYYAEVAHTIAAWTQREMQSPHGAYYTALDADSEHEEGKFYVWQTDEVQSLLSPEEWRIAAPYYGLDLAPNFEDEAWHLYIATPLPLLAKQLNLDEATCAAHIASARTKLLAARAHRIRPGLDDKVLTSWNALMIEGMAHAGRVLGQTEWVQSAQRACDFIRTQLWQNGQLIATCKGTPGTPQFKAHLNAYLDDYAFMLAALLELMQADFRIEDLHFATALADALLEGFEDTEHGGFYFTHHQHEALIQRPRSGHDNAMPSGNGVAAQALNRLGHLLGEARYTQAAERTVQCFMPQMQHHPAGFATLCMALDEILQPPHILILRGEAAALADWQKALHAGQQQTQNQSYAPHRLTLCLPTNTADLPTTLNKPAPAAGNVNAWLCQGVNCLPAFTSLPALQAHFAEHSA